MITLEADTKSNKTGFEYFNELFMQRHKKILWKTAKRQTYMIAFIIVVIIGILFYDVETQKDANNAMTSILPFFVFQALPIPVNDSIHALFLHLSYRALLPCGSTYRECL